MNKKELTGMAHFGAICDPGPSHVMAMTAICGELQNRGHRVTLFPFPDFEDPSIAAGFDVRPSHIESDFLKERIFWISTTETLRPGDFVRIATERARLVCEHGPENVRTAGIDCLLADGIDPGAATVAESLNLPFVTINNALPLNGEAAVPPDFVPWHYHDALWARARNWIAYRLRDIAVRPLHQLLNRYRRKWGLRPYRSPNDSFSPYAQITQLIPEFDYPRRRLPICFHYVGPYRRHRRTETDFPFERLDGRPLVYASLGTIQGSRSYLWDSITSACAELDVQLVLTLGKCSLSPETHRWRGNPIVVTYAPQTDLLSRASAAILHGGMNSAMEALAAGVPTVTIPIIGDQFGVAARVVHSGTGEAIPARACTPDRLRAVLKRVLNRPLYTQRAQELRLAVERTRGSQAAADIAEEVAATRRPVQRM